MDSSHTPSDRRRFVANKLQIKEWSRSLSSVETYLSEMNKQLKAAKEGGGPSHPWPMFEVLTKSTTKMGFAMNFHVLCAEESILRDLISRKS